MHIMERHAAGKGYGSSPDCKALDTQRRPPPPPTHTLTHTHTHTHTHTRARARARGTLLSHHETKVAPPHSPHPKVCLQFAYSHSTLLTLTTKSPTHHLSPAATQSRPQKPFDQRRAEGYKMAVGALSKNKIRA